MLYLFLLIVVVITAFSASQFIKIPSYHRGIFHFFLQQLVLLTFIITLFATITAQGQSVYIIFLPFYFYLFKNKLILISAPDKGTFISNSKYLLLLVPVISIQFFLHVDLSDGTPYLPSDDILLYSSYSSHLVKFKSENRYEALSLLYPSLFSGVSPYHFYELWFAAMVGYFTGKSYVFVLLFVVYPYLVWLLVLGILSLFEHFASKISVSHYLFTFVLLFVGPVYLSIYEEIFSDGNFLSTTVFTITGFVKQTLAFSYYGQKHLPIYLVSLLAFLFLLKKNNQLFVIILCCSAILSFGTFPGIYGALGLLLLQKRFRTFSNVSALFSMAVLLMAIPAIFDLGINKEISAHTFYFNDFLKYLNIKGELVRVIAKFICPAVWFLILYFPLVLLIAVYRKRILENEALRVLLLFLFFSFLSGAGFISIVQGINSDQFLTNLLPIYNVILVVLLVYLYTLPSSKKIIVFGGTFIAAIINLSFVIRFHSVFRQKTEEVYSVATLNSVREELKGGVEDPLIAYLLPDSIIDKYPPVIWYPYKPGKALFLDNHLTHVNINYPYHQYERNSASIAFSPNNQMRFYLKDSVVSESSFAEYQVQFLKDNKIIWLFCAKGVILNKELEKMIVKRYYDDLSDEYYYKLQ